MTRSLLRVGTPRLPADPPHGNPPCLEPMVYGANILNDPGVELHLANTGGGPNGDEIPAYEWRAFGTTPFAELQWSDGWANGTKSTGSLADIKTCFWAGSSNDLVTPKRCLVSTANPHSGTYHGRAVGNQGTVFMLQQKGCAGPNLGDEYGHIYTGRCETGNFLEMEIWAMVASGTPGITLYFDLFQESGNKDRTINSFGLTLSTSYQKFTFSTFVPAANFPSEGPVHHFTAYFFSNTSANFDFDDGLIGVS